MKNNQSQPPFATSDKPRLVPVSDPAEIAAIEAGWGGTLDSIAGAKGPRDQYYADADDLKRWRARRAGSNKGAP